MGNPGEKVACLKPQDIEAHNEMVAELWHDFECGDNRRVPIKFATDEFLWLSLTGNTFREFYTHPPVQLEVQLAGDAWFRESVVGDQPMGAPAEAWTVCPRFWMDEPEWFGCDVVIQDNDFAWSKPLQYSKPDLLVRLADIDPKEAVMQSRLWRLYQDMKDIAQSMTYLGLPVRVTFPGAGTHGIFTVAGLVRGPQLYLDMLDDPDFACEFLGIITDKTIGRMLAWHELAETGDEVPSADGWGMGDDALQLISRDMYERIVLPHHERIYSAMTIGKRGMHLCGHAQQHFRTLYEALDITSLDGPGTFVDHGALLAAMPQLTISAQTDHTITLLGSIPKIEEMMHGMLRSSSKQPGRFFITGGLCPTTPLAHVRATYEAGKREGRIRPRP